MKLMRADCMAVMNATPLRSAMLEPSESSEGTLLGCFRAWRVDES